jgi:hypothetical protein
MGFCCCCCGAGEGIERAYGQFKREFHGSAFELFIFAARRAEKSKLHQQLTAGRWLLYVDATIRIKLCSYHRDIVETTGCSVVVGVGRHMEHGTWLLVFFWVPLSSRAHVRPTVNTPTPHKAHEGALGINQPCLQPRTTIITKTITQKTDNGTPPSSVLGKGVITRSTITISRKHKTI